MEALAAWFPSLSMKGQGVMVTGIMIFIFALMFLVLALCAYSILSKLKRKGRMDMDESAQKVDASQQIALDERNRQRFGAEKQRLVRGSSPGSDRALRVRRPAAHEAESEAAFLL